MTFSIKINLDNAAFTEDPGYEVQRMFQELAELVLALTAKLDRGVPTGMAKGDRGTLRDVNGNTLGEWRVR